MKKICFQKYSLYGNTFVLIDENKDVFLSESEKSRFASFATDNFFGIGADNLIVVQPCTSDVLRSINTTRKYWGNHQPSDDADFLLRMFEPSGEEAFSCGNGAMCIADHLNHSYGIKDCRIMTQIPTKNPKIISIGHDQYQNLAWANLGKPTKPPESMAHGYLSSSSNEFLYEIKQLPLTIHNPRLNGKKSVINFEISGHLIFTGEPHMIILTETGFSIPNMTNAMFIHPDSNEGKIKDDDLETSYSSWLVHSIGYKINQTFKSLFPFGININFVRVIDPCSTVEFRSFERGINHETLACGTGAVAVSAVTHALGICNSDETIVWPHRCRWYHPDFSFTVKKSDNDWYVFGNPLRLYQGHLAID